MGKEIVVMQDVCWSFSGAKFADRATFESELIQYQKDIQQIDAWDPSELVVHVPQIRVQYMCWQDEDQIEPIITLSSENGISFSAGELMFALHNAVVEQLDEIDHHFFEGLLLAKNKEEDGKLPLYILQQGS